MNGRKLYGVWGQKMSGTKISVAVYANFESNMFEVVWQKEAQNTKTEQTTQKFETLEDAMNFAQGIKDALKKILELKGGQ